MTEPFLVVYPEFVRLALKQLCDRARQTNRGAQALEAIRRIDLHLSRDPHSFGEEKFRYPKLNLIRHLAIDPPFAVHFAVHETKPLVFVQEWVPLPGSGLD